MGALGVVAALSAAPFAGGALHTAEAALVIHAPDGRVVVPPALQPVDPPLVLTTDSDAPSAQMADEDVLRYRRIFALQDRAEWDAADREIAHLGDKRLLGYVLRQRYLHPDRRASYGELADWMRRFGDLAGAERIHSLAERRQPAGERAPKPPRGNDVVRLNGSLEMLGGLRPTPDPSPEGDDAQGDSSGGDSSAGDAPADDTAAADPDKISVAPRSRTSRADRSDDAAVAQVRSLLRAGKTAAALALLGDDDVGRKLDSVQYDTARARIAASLYYAGNVKEALSLASASAARSGDVVTEASWIAGLAAWRLKQYDRAARHFDTMAAARPRSPWMAAAADYWAARAAARRGHDTKARTHLAAAARFPHTFYGLIALRTLGGTDDLGWRTPELTGAMLTALADSPEGARAIALLQVGQKDLAEMELRRIHPHGDARIERALVALADRAGLSALALQVGNAVPGPDGAPYTAALYPVPYWTPRDGFAVDRALLYAVMRQESRFDPRLVSSAGALGLMQIMPSTAQHVQSRNADIGDADTERTALFDPATNMELGQRYLAELLASPDVDNNLFLMAAAYNAGPGTLAHWRKDLSDIRDPLLFIESIPYAETRGYVKKVAANFWIYRLRFGQEMGALDAVAAGRWPLYMPVDARPTQVAQHAED